MKGGVSVVGAGGWGTALAVLLGRKGIDVLLWSRRDEQTEGLQKARINEVYLSQVPIPDSVRFTSDLAAVTSNRLIILAVPSQALRDLWSSLGDKLSTSHSVLNAAKGLEVSTGLRLSQVLECGAGTLPSERIAVLSGPNHAEEVGLGMPTTSVVASTNSEISEAWQECLMSRTFRVYTNEDLIGVELGGALKNVIALAAGISDGLGFGDNTKAALVTRGLAEMGRLGVAMGAKLITFSGLAGMGDLVATCTSLHSRNTRAGRSIGEGVPPADVVQGTPMVIEGIPSCQAAMALARARRVEMPITEAVGEVLFKGKKPAQAVEELMGRGPKDELAALGQ